MATKVTADSTNPTDVSRFGIGEWYGQPFTDLTPEERLEFAHYRRPAGKTVSSKERERVRELREKRRVLAANGGVLAPREADRLAVLEAKLLDEAANTKPCPFKNDGGLGQVPCTKEGGVCSLRLYDKGPNDRAVLVPAPRGAIRATCPSRFHEAGTAFSWASREILNQADPALVGEVGFLESSETVDASEGEDVGRIDMVVVDNKKPADYPLPWIALEIQAVYFSGPEMRLLFDQIDTDVYNGQDGLVFPGQIRRPDYRSSGPKRLMPQLMIKVPTLRRWGKRMAVVVDRSFYDSMGSMTTVDDVSNSDVAWFVVDFVYDAGTRRFALTAGHVFFMTLEEAVKGLTGGKPVKMSEFETRIRAGIKTHLP